MPSTPWSAAFRASSASRMPFSTSFPGQCRRTQARSSQVTAGSNWESTQVLKPSGLDTPGTAFSRLPKVCGRPLQAHVPGPRRVEAEVEALDHPAPGLSGPGHPVAGLPVARAHHREVDGQHQHRAAGGHRPGHQVLGVRRSRIT